LIVQRQDESLTARKEIFEYNTRHQLAVGTIKDSLFLAADAAGLPASLTMSLADIFAWDIDFHVDIRTDDSFAVLYVERYLKGRSSQPGRILAAGIENKGKSYWAFSFGQDGKEAYYDQDGRALRKAFLKSPLKYSRISSTFSHRRFHPILKTYRPHLGVDYAAPAGTPIRSIGDGKIAFAGWKSGYGRYIKIKHNNTYASTYGHLKSFAKGIQRGKHVRQGDVIGYVGATGLATGPHLDFRLLKNEQFINPLKVNFPSADPVAKEEMTEFKKQVEQYLLEIKNGKAVSPAPPYQLISLQMAQLSS
jgi:murein DD-endopeptidase MepM/ murein hydrolase activator NlpD